MWKTQRTSRRDNPDGQRNEKVLQTWDFVCFTIHFNKIIKWIGKAYKGTILLTFNFFRLIYFYWKGILDLKREGETERKTFHPRVHSPIGCTIQRWADPKPGFSSFSQVFHMGAGSQGFGPSSTAFPDHKQGAGWEVGLPGLELAPHGIAARSRRGL